MNNVKQNNELVLGGLPAVEKHGGLAFVRDLVALTKPSVTWLTVLMAAGGMALAPASARTGTVVWTLIGTALAVGSANALNMYLERETDGLMHRTRRRPLPAGRMLPGVALGFGALIGAVSMLLLAVLVNPVTAALACFAILSYVLVYTPLKRVTHLALPIGAVPGAVPPLLGWTAVQGSIEWPGLVLFLILFVWQLPHFMAIALYNKADYERAGIRVVPVVLGERVARVRAVVYAAVLIPTSLLLLPLGVAGWLYGIVAVGAGSRFLAVGIQGLQPAAGTRWARRFFRASLLYLPALVAALWIERWVG